MELNKQTFQAICQDLEQAMLGLKHCTVEGKTEKPDEIILAEAYYAVKEVFTFLAEPAVRASILMVLDRDMPASDGVLIVDAKQRQIIH